MLQEEQVYSQLLSKLSPREQRFVVQFVTHGNGARAARVAGYSQKNARVIASQILAKLNIRAAIEAGFNAMRVRCEIDADKIVRELAAVGFSNVTHFEFDNEGYLQLAEDAPAEALRAIAGVKRKTRVLDDGSVLYESEFRLWPKLEALNLLGKRLRLWVDRIETENPQDAAYRLLLQRLKEGKP